MFYQRLLTVACALALVALPAVASGAAAAGGTVAGTITDQKGAVVVGAAVTVTDEAGGQNYTATTDGQGRYKVEGLPAGLYAVNVAAEGFTEFRQEGVKVEEGKAVALNARLEVALQNSSVTVSSGGTLKANADPLYQTLRKQASAAADFAGPYATVTNLVIKRDAGVFTLKSGELYFLQPVEGRVTGAVFVGEGELNLVPPTDEEKRSLALFTDQPTLTEQFTQLVLRFTDQTFDEVKSSPNARMGAGGAQAERARELYRANESVARKELRTNFDLRTLTDLYSTNQRPGFFVGFVGGKRYNKLLYVLDPLGIPFVSPEQVALVSRGQTDGGIWTAFYLADEYRRGTANSKADRRIADVKQHDLDVVIRGTRLVATDRVSVRALVSGSRVIPFDLYPGLRVARVQDEQGGDLNFVQESKTEDGGDFAVILPQITQAAKTYKLTIQYEGDGALKDYGGGNFALVERESWYPSAAGTQFGDRAVFNMTFRYPKGQTFVGTGALTEPESVDGEMKVAKWSSGATELAVAGFNYGKFKKKEVADADTGYNIEFFANTVAAPDIQSRQSEEKMAEMATGERIEVLTGGQLMATGASSTVASADRALEEAQNSVRIYDVYFGKLPYTRVAMTQQPFGNFGQSWPTLVYMPYTAFLSTTERSNLFGSTKFGSDSFWDYVGPHEIAHQWWGHAVGWPSYHDQWMSEGFAEFSASLYVQYVRKDLGKFNEFWEEQRHLIVDPSPATKGRRPYTVGPVTMGYRLTSPKTGGVTRRLIYPKGAYILHMLRMLMFDRKTGDQRFKAMMQDFVKSNYNKDVSTEDFKRVVDKHTVPEADIDENHRMDWFFKEWVYGTEVPSYRFEYQISGNGFSGKVTQSGVSDQFVMRVPIYVDYGRGWTRLASVRLNGNSSLDIPTQQLPQTPKRLAVAALNDVLAVEIENVKK
jgi:hypothetical protein